MQPIHLFSPVKKVYFFNYRNKFVFTVICTPRDDHIQELCLHFIIGIPKSVKLLMQNVQHVFV